MSSSNSTTTRSRLLNEAIKRMQQDLPILEALNQPFDYVAKEAGSLSPIARRRACRDYRLANRPVTPSAGHQWEGEESLTALNPTTEANVAVAVPREKVEELIQLQNDLPHLSKEGVVERGKALMYVVTAESRPNFERMLKTREHAEEAFKALKTALSQLTCKEIEDIKLMKVPCPADIEAVKAVLQLAMQLDREGVIKFREVKQWNLLRKQIPLPAQLLKLLRGLPDYLLRHKVNVRWRRGDVNPELAGIAETLRQASAMSDNLAKLRRKTNLENCVAMSAQEVEELEEVVKKEERELQDLKKHLKEQQRAKVFRQFDSILQQVVADQLARHSTGSWSEDLCSRVEQLGLLQNGESKALFTEFVAKAESTYTQIRSQREVKGSDRAQQPNWRMQQLAREKRRLPNYLEKFRRR